MKSTRALSSGSQRASRQSRRDSDHDGLDRFCSDLVAAVAVGLILAGFMASRWIEHEQDEGR